MDQQEIEGKTSDSSEDFQFTFGDADESSPSYQGDLSSDDDAAIVEPAKPAPAPTNDIPDPDFRRERKFSKIKMMLGTVLYEKNGRCLIQVTIENGNSIFQDKAWVPAKVMQYANSWVSASGKWSISKKNAELELSVYSAEPGFPHFMAGSIAAMESIFLPVMIGWSNGGSILAWQNECKAKIAQFIASQGDDCLTRLMKDFSPCLNIFGETATQKEGIAKAWVNATNAIHLRKILTDSGFSGHDIESIIDRWRENTYEVLSRNPYAIVSMGFSLDKAEKLVKTMKSEPRRGVKLVAHMRNALNKITEKTGSTAIRLEALLSEILAFEPMDIIDIQNIVTVMKATKGELDVSVRNVKGTSYCGIGYIMAEEINFATWVASHLNDIRKERKSLTKEYEALYRRAVILAAKALKSMMGDLPLDPAQVAAVALSAIEPISILTGGPGTGKSTVSKALVMVLEQLARDAQSDLTIHLASPTGKAAVRLAEMAGRPAKTINSLLRMLPDSSAASGYSSASNIFSANDAILIDEASMMDVNHAAALMQACPEKFGPRFRLVFIGDDAQLDPVGPGRPLADMLAACHGGVARIPVSRLTKVHRQAENGGIALGAAIVRRREMPDVPQVKTMSDISAGNVGIMATKSSEISAVIAHEYRSMLSAGEDPMQDALVLCPMRRGPGGVHECNRVIANVLNGKGAPILPSDQWTGDGPVPRVGDRIITRRPITHSVNGASANIVNSATGKIIEKTGNALSVLFDGETTPKLIPHTEWDSLMMGYAITIHKSQGSQCKNVIMTAVVEHEAMLDNQLFYTGWTRAIDKLMVLGDLEAIEMSIKTNRSLMRRTIMRDVLEANLIDDPIAVSISVAEAPQPISDRQIIKISLPEMFKSISDDQDHNPYDGVARRREMAISV